MIKAVLVDDERLAREELKKLLSSEKQIEIVGEASNAEEARVIIKEKEPDLLFLDIQMPGEGGFELLSALDSVPYVIFATAYDEFALQAFEVNALDYLVKPIEPARLSAAVKKAVTRIREEALEQETFERKLGPYDKVFVKDGDRCWFVKLEEVRLFESVGNYVRLHFGDEKPLIHKSLNGLGEKLDERVFFRANRQQIINLNWVIDVKSWFSGSLMLELKGGEKIELSRRQSVKFKELKSL